MITREQVDSGVLDWLNTSTGKKIGDMKIPKDVPAGEPYGILYPVVIPEPTGGWENPSEDWEFIYQVTCVGKDRRQCGWMSSRVAEVWTDQFQFPLIVAGVPPQYRLLGQRGAILPSGDFLFACQDTYRLKIGVM